MNCHFPFWPPSVVESLCPAFLVTACGLFLKPCLQLNWIDPIENAFRLLDGLGNPGHHLPFLAVPSQARLLSTERPAHCG